VGELGGDKRFGDVASVVGCRSVNLGRVLSGVSTTTVGCPTTIGVYDNFSSSETGISGGTTDIKATRGVDNILSIDQKLLGADLLDDLVNEGGADGLVVDIGAMLGGDKDVENSDGLQSSVGVFVFQDNLRFAVGSQPWDLSGVAESGHFLVDFARKLVRVRVESLLIPFISGISEHDSLITSTEVIFVGHSVDGSGDVGILSFDNLNDFAFGAIETICDRGKSNLHGSVSGTLFEVNLLGSDVGLSHEADDVRLASSLHCNLSRR